MAPGGLSPGPGGQAGANITSGDENNWTPERPHRWKGAGHPAPGSAPEGLPAAQQVVRPTFMGEDFKAQRG